MSKKKDKPLIFNYKIKRFMVFHYIDKLEVGQSYLQAGFKARDYLQASKNGFFIKQRLESDERFEEIVRQLNPVPEIVSEMIRISREAKDPNLRYKTIAQIGKWAGLERANEGALNTGISINILSNRAAVQVAADEPGQVEGEAKKKAIPEKTGKPESFIK